MKFISQMVKSISKMFNIFTKYTECRESPIYIYLPKRRTKHFCLVFLLSRVGRYLSPLSYTLSHPLMNQVMHIA